MTKIFFKPAIYMPTLINSCTCEYKTIREDVYYSTLYESGNVEIMYLWLIMKMN